MKLDVRFSENNMSINVTLPNEPESFDPNMGEVVVVHDGQNGVTSWNDLTDKPFYELPPAFDIQWDGDMAGHDTFEVETDVYFVKVSDEVYTAEQLIDATVCDSDGYVENITAENIYTDVPGMLALTNGPLIIYSAADFIKAIDFPEGSFSNGIWFIHEPEFYNACLVARTEIKKLDSKYFDLEGYAKTEDLKSYAKTEDLKSYAKTEDLKSYAKTEDLKSYAKTEDLKSYAKTEDLSAVATSGSYNDLTDKPFGEEETWVELWAENQYTGKSNRIPLNAVPLSKPSTSMSGKCRYTFNGVEYETDIVTRETPYTTVFIGGNPCCYKPEFEDNGQPIAFIYTEKYREYILYLLFDINSTGETVSFSAEKLEIVSKPLDEKYLPDTIARTEDIPNYDNLVNDVIAKLPVYDGEVIAE